MDALTLILQALAIGSGDEVLVPANTFIATWLAVAHVGARPVPVDCDDLTGNIAPTEVRSSLTSRTKAILPVHLYGHPAELDELCHIAREAGVYLIEDAAQAHGARYRGRPVGTFGIASALSFYPTKNLGAMGDGGAVVTNDPDLANKIRLLRSYGSRTKYHHEMKGANSRLDELHAALLAVKLRYLDAWNAERREIAATYRARFEPLAAVRPAFTADDAEPVCHLYTIRSPHRDALAAALAGRGVQTIIRYPAPPHLQPAFADLGFGKGSFPVTETISSEILSLPLWPGMTPAQIDCVTEAVRLASVALDRASRTA